MNIVRHQFKDALVYKQNFKIIFNGNEFHVFKERLENCCFRFYSKLMTQINCNRLFPNNDNTKETSYDVFEYNDKDIKESTFAAFVDCINGKEISITEENSDELVILGIEFGYDRLTEECRQYMKNIELEKKEEIRLILKKLISQVNSKNSSSNNKDGDNGNSAQERDLHELEHIISKYFNIAIESNENNKGKEGENAPKLIWEIPIEVLNRILKNDSFNKSKLNDNQKHLLVQLVIYHLKKEGKEASVLLSGFNWKYFSNSDIELLINEESFLTFTLKLEKEDIKEMIEKDKKNEWQEKYIEVMRAEIKSMRKDMNKIIDELLKKKSFEIEERKEKENRLIINEIKKIKANIKYLDLDTGTLIDIPYPKGIFEFFIEHFKENPISSGAFLGFENSNYTNSQNSNILPDLITKNSQQKSWCSKGPSPSLEFDFSGLFYVSIDKYLFNLYYGYSSPFEWKVEGRMPEGHWVILDCKKDNMIFRQSPNEHVIQINTQTPIYISAVRIRFFLTENSEMKLSRFELYGKIIKI